MSTSAPTNNILALPVKDYVVVSEKGDNATARPNDTKLPYATLDAAVRELPPYGTIKLDAGYLRIDRPWSPPKGYRMISESGPNKTKLVSYLRWDQGPAIPLTDNCVIGSFRIEAASFLHGADGAPKEMAGVYQMLIGCAEGATIPFNGATAFNVHGYGNSDVVTMLAKLPCSLKLYDCFLRSWWDDFAFGYENHSLEAFGCHVEKLNGSSGLALNVGGISVWDHSPHLRFEHGELVTGGERNFIVLNGGLLEMVGCGCAFPNDPAMKFVSVTGNSQNTKIVLDGVTGLTPDNIALGEPPATLIVH